MVFYNLKALIKAIRATKTIADERALIVKESAVIRTSFKEEGEFDSHPVLDYGAVAGEGARRRWETPGGQAVMRACRATRARVDGLQVHLEWVEGCSGVHWSIGAASSTTGRPLASSGRATAR